MSQKDLTFVQFLIQTYELCGELGGRFGMEFDIVWGHHGDGLWWRFLIHWLLELVSEGNLLILAEEGGVIATN